MFEKKLLLFYLFQCTSIRFLRIFLILIKKIKFYIYGINKKKIYTT